eukprot:comp19293_c0_seq1/m.22134 comp19293_c0_seq1/g.22134  ORF comp19293_c0_seq1/g.22134 comp19293_c0_seq1/m.22134 type:complete len:255 (-) comp19293_c0_seq1:270-1034(-)
MSQPIRLWSVHATTTRRYGQHTYSFSADALVGPVGERKRVLMFGEARDDQDGYADFCGEFKFMEPTGDPSLERWCLDWEQFHKFASQLRFRPTRLDRVSVVVRNSDDGKCFVDDFLKMFYTIPLDCGEILYYDNVHYLTPLNRTGPTLRPDETQLGGYVVLKNLAVDKRVDVVYTVDNWATVRTAAARYSKDQWMSWYSSANNPNTINGGNETWYFTLDVGNAPAVQLAVRYQTAGREFWDSNFGKNYHVSRTS